MLVESTLRHFGTETNAQIVAYELYENGPRNTHIQTNDVSVADGLALVLSYDNRTSVVFIDSSDKMFTSLYQSIQKAGVYENITIHYFPILPALALPDFDLYSSDHSIYQQMD